MPETQEAAKPWTPPDSDQEFVFEDIASAPAWVDKSWAGYSNGPALAVPTGDLFGNGAWTTETARIGDTVKWTAPKGATPGKFTIIPGEPDPSTGAGTRKPPQVSSASLEDMLKTGLMVPGELGEDAKGQVLGRSPGMRPIVEDGGPTPEKQAVGDIVLME